MLGGLSADASGAIEQRATNAGNAVCVQSCLLLETVITSECANSIADDIYVSKCYSDDRARAETARDAVPNQALTLPCAHPENRVPCLPRLQAGGIELLEDPIALLEASCPRFANRTSSDEPEPELTVVEARYVTFTRIQETAVSVSFR